MTYSGPSRTAARRTRSKTIAAVVVIGVALAVVLSVVFFLRDPRSDAIGANPDQSSTGVPDAPPTADMGPPGQPDRGERRDPSAQAGEADGAVPAGVTVFGDEFAAVTNLDADLLAALRKAAKAAEDDGVQFVVNSGWRSESYQTQLLRDAVAEYGSEKEASRWVATPETSPHVKGMAIDLGPTDSLPWLAKNGERYGLCQIYQNEPWHYELRPDGCPPMYSDPTQDPRMRR
ncbi:M15 family metallopeptidase [Umezawaea endophytica]|uniref:M15 family metallopeptidase n=1 Tax=Umezawaea endophytica TaxID=1654476 RepID=A0A9X2VJP0_9PSEU|nr:M15 family metallopeptidase [Umezawaea endophytica]MCS7477873.1 M15 family metallopeptidase [Umezawaea endophytica]